MLPRSSNAAHIGMRGVEHDFEILMIHALVQSHNFGRFVEGETRFKLPNYGDSVLLCDGCSLAPNRREAVECTGILAIRDGTWCGNRVDSNRGAADVDAHPGTKLKQLQVFF